MYFKFKMQNAGQTKVLGSWNLAMGHVSSPLIFIQSLSQGVAQLSQICSCIFHHLTLLRSSKGCEVAYIVPDANNCELLDKAESNGLPVLVVNENLLIL